MVMQRLDTAGRIAPSRMGMPEQVEEPGEIMAHPSKTVSLVSCRGFYRRAQKTMRDAGRGLCGFRNGPGPVDTGGPHVGAESNEANRPDVSRKEPWMPLEFV